MAATATAAAALAAALLAPDRAIAEPLRWQLQLEAGSEYDSNVHRVEVTGEANTAVPEASPLARAGSRVDLSYRPASRQALHVGGVATGKLFGDRAAASDEDVLVVSGDARYDWILRSRRAALGARVTFYDAFGSEADADGAGRNFATGTGEGQLLIAGPGEHRVMLHSGYQMFRYKPDGRFDWDGDVHGLRWQTTWWFGAGDSPPDEGADPADAADPAGALSGKPDEPGLGSRGGDETSLELAIGYQIERRQYAGKAFTNGCRPGTEPSPVCFVPTTLDRADLAHTASAELTYTGDRVYSARYSLAVNDSNSFGQSLVRQRLTVAATAELPWRLYATAQANVQLNLFLDPLLLARGVQNQTFTTIDEENRNSLALQLARDLGPSWSIEGRWSLFGNELATEEVKFRRQTVYLGAVYRMGRTAD